MIKILIADDHPFVRDGIKNVLERAIDLKEIGEAESSEQVFKMVAKEKWDVIILDLNMPGIGGIEILKELKNSHPKLPVIVLSTYSEELYGVSTIKAGASAFLNKSTSPSELVKAILQIVKGKKYIRPSLAEKLADHMDHDSEKQAHFSLSDRELEVMRLIGSGLKVSEIADKLCVSVSSINSYRSRLLEKMQFKTNSDIIRYIINNKLFE